MAATSSRLAHGELDFALPQAANLAEAGVTTSDKRIGIRSIHFTYPLTVFIVHGRLFVLYRSHASTTRTSTHASEHSTKGIHQIDKRVSMYLIINLIPQDLENSSIPRISLALDILIHSATEDVVPAVQFRLHELISHNSSVCIFSKRTVPSINIFMQKRPQIRRRALLAFRALARYDPEPLKRVASKVQKHLRDTEPSVVGAALVVCADVVRAERESFKICIAHRNFRRDFQSRRKSLNL